jgi:hypothetical protein
LSGGVFSSFEVRFLLLLKQQKNVKTTQIKIFLKKKKQMACCPIKGTPPKDEYFNSLAAKNAFMCAIYASGILGSLLN